MIGRRGRAASALGPRRPPIVASAGRPSERRRRIAWRRHRRGTVRVIPPRPPGSPAGARCSRCWSPRASSRSASARSCRSSRSTTRSTASTCPTLGVVVAAWPAARLVGEPFFGRLADRASRKTMMVAALLVSAVAVMLPVVVSGTLAFIVLRAHRGTGCRRVRPGRARLPRGREPARAAGRDVRPVQRGADGRLHGGAGGGRPRRRDHRRAHGRVLGVRPRLRSCRPLVVGWSAWPTSRPRRHAHGSRRPAAARSARARDRSRACADACRAGRGRRRGRRRAVRLLNRLLVVALDRSTSAPTSPAAPTRSSGACT